MTMFFTSSRFDDPLIYRACCFLRMPFLPRSLTAASLRFVVANFVSLISVQCTKSSLTAHSVAPPLPDCRGKVISHSDRYSIFKVLMKRPFTYSHWVNSNSNPKRKNICEFENPSHLFAQRVSKCTPVFGLSPEKLFEKFIPPPIPTGKSQMHPLNGKIFPNEKPPHSFGQRVPKCTPIFEVF